MTLFQLHTRLLADATYLGNLLLDGRCYIVSFLRPGRRREGSGRVSPSLQVRSRRKPLL